MGVFSSFFEINGREDILRQRGSTLFIKGRFVFNAGDFDALEISHVSRFGIRIWSFEPCSQFPALSKQTNFLRKTKTFNF